jgi:hypothetical protein
MQHRTWIARGAVACVVAGGALAGCGGAAKPAATVDAPIAPAPQPAPRDEPRHEAVGLRDLGSLDAGRAADSAKADASRARGRNAGRLPPEAIQAVMRKNFGSFRTCYENGLRTSPNLQGRVNVRFVIDVDGDVSSAADEKSELVDPAIVKCVVAAVGKLQFPKPEGGLVTVVYPIVFNPGD